MQQTQTADLGALSIGEGVRRTTLSNGLTVLTKEVHTYPIVASVVWYRVGSRNEEFGQTGKSHFLEHMLFKGTSGFPKGSIDGITLRNGGANNAFTWLDYTAYYFTFASDRWEVALEIESDRMRNVLFDADEFASEKQVVLEELRIGLDGPWEELDHEVWATAFRQHPYRNPTVGWVDDLVDATADDMKAYYDQWYHPRNATLVLVGDFDTDRALARVEELFGPIPAGPEPRAMRVAEPSQRGEKRLSLRKATSVERLLIGYHVPEVGHPDSYALQLAEFALATGRTSRLYKRLVEGDRSVTATSAGYEDHMDPTLLTIRAELKPGSSLEGVERAILEEVDRLVADGITDEELARVKRCIRADLVLSNEQVLNQALLLGEYETIFGHRWAESDRAGYRYLDDYFLRVSAVTRDDVRSAAAKYFTASNRTVGVLVPDGGAPVAASESAAPAARSGRDEWRPRLRRRASGRSAR
jgi:zinc protease